VARSPSVFQALQWSCHHTSALFPGIRLARHRRSETATCSTSSSVVASRQRPSRDSDSVLPLASPDLVLPARVPSVPPAPHSPGPASRDRARHCVGRGVGRGGHPRGGDTGRWQEPAAGAGGARAARRRRGGAGVLGGAARQPPPAGGGGVCRPGLALGSGARAVGARGRERARPEPRAGRLRDHLPGGGRRPGPAPGRVPPAPDPSGARRGAPPAGAGGGGGGRAGPGGGLVGGAAAAAVAGPGAAAALRHAGARGRTAYPVAAIPPRGCGRGGGGGLAQDRRG